MKIKSKNNCFYWVTLTLLLFLALILSSSKKIIYDSKVFYEVIFKSVENFDSITYLGKNREPGNVYVLKIIKFEEDLNNFTFSITSIINGNILNDLKPFYFIIVDGDIAILPASDIPYQSFLCAEFYEDEAFEEITHKSFFWLFYDFRSYPLIDFPTVGIYSFKMPKKIKKGVIKYFISYPISSVPFDLRPILDYKTDEFYHVDSTGEIQILRFDNHFLKHQKIDDMFDNKIEFKFRHYRN